MRAAALSPCPSFFSPASVPECRIRVRLIRDAVVAWNADGTMLIAVPGEGTRRARHDRCAWCGERDFHPCRGALLETSIGEERYARCLQIGGSA